MVESSPHARGSSRRRRRAAGADGVVPARAGIFPDWREVQLPWWSRPRTRGDLPGPAPPPRWPPWSSPHARGSSRRDIRPLRDDDVVPARAGIFRRSWDDPRQRSGRPRTRGDLPHAGPGGRARRMSSPHARGSSRARDAMDRAAQVVPARAGIFPPSNSFLPRCQGRPRTRGDLPAKQTIRHSVAASSPHARGSSHRERAKRGDAVVVPARAGIFRSTAGTDCGSGCRPRTRGDLPTNTARVETQKGSSPHARGSSHGR